MITLTDSEVTAAIEALYGRLDLLVPGTPTFVTTSAALGKLRAESFRRMRLYAEQVHA